jgi:hypothetical protein
MVEYLIDLGIVTVLIVGFTAMLGSITGGIALALFGRQKSEFVSKGQTIQTGWKQVGGGKVK